MPSSSRWIVRWTMLFIVPLLSVGCSESPPDRGPAVAAKNQRAAPSDQRPGPPDASNDQASALPKRSPFADIEPPAAHDSAASVAANGAIAAPADNDAAVAAPPDNGHEAATTSAEAPRRNTAADSQESGDVLAKQGAPGDTDRRREDAQNSDGTYGKDHVDPVKLNGPIFEKWPKPKAALLFSGAQDGYIEPCGCAGLENQKGGLSRRHQLVKKLTASGWPLASFDAGGLVKRYGRQQELKYAASVEGLKTMGYDAVTFSGDDLRLALEELIGAIAPVDDRPSPFVATNVAIVNFELPRHKIVKVAGLRIGVLAVVGEEEQRKVNNAEIQFQPAANAIAKELPALVNEKCDKLILLAHTTSKEAEALAQQFGDFDYVVTTAGAEEPPAQPKRIGKRTQLIEVGHKGMYCVVIGLYDNQRTPERYQRVPLDARFGESDELHQILVSYQDQLKELGLTGLNVAPLAGPPKHPKSQKFIGSAACGECHTKAYAIWKETPHAHATDTIVKLSPPRHFDPECLSCHVTGWDPQGYQPFASGYLDFKQKYLHGNGCENCHGPGSRHAAAQAGEIDVTDRELKDLQRSMKVTLAEAKQNLCLKCHDLDNSPHYDWDKYWPQVEHKGKD